MTGDDPTPVRATRVFLASLGYRVEKCLEGAPEGFDAFTPGHGVRPVAEIVDHVSDMLDLCRKVIDPEGYAAWKERSTGRGDGAGGEEEREWEEGTGEGEEDCGGIGETEESSVPRGDLPPWRRRFHRSLRLLHTTLREHPDFGEGKARRLLQGPVADALTHAGQLAMMRRLAGSPLPAESYYRADMEAWLFDEA